MKRVHERPGKDEDVSVLNNRANGCLASSPVPQNRPLFEDVREMLCADAIATARSSINFLTFAHTKANAFFLPSPCGDGTYRRMKHPPAKATYDNTTLLQLERPGAEVRSTWSILRLCFVLLVGFGRMGI